MNMRGAGEKNTSASTNAMAMVLRVCTIVGLVVVVARVAQLQLAPSAELREFISARTTSKSLPANRGDLLDRRGRVLATTQVGLRVGLVFDFRTPAALSTSWVSSCQTALFYQTSQLRSAKRLRDRNEGGGSVCIGGIGYLG